MRRKAIIVMVLFLSVPLTVAWWFQPAAAYELNVKAWIDGESQLIIQGNTVQWHNLAYVAPGYEAQTKLLPTYLTTAHMGTVAWKPTGWSDGTYGDTTSAPFTKLKLPLAAAEQTVILNKISVRVNATIAQQPAAANGFTLIVDFDDQSESSADWYEVSLEYLPGALSAYQDLGILPGMTESQAYAINIKGQATGESWITGVDYSRAFFWDPKTMVLMQELGTPAEWDTSRGDAINAKGQVAGELKKTGTGVTHIFFWDPKTNAMQDLGNLGGNDAWVAWHSGINDKGQMCGSSEISAGGPWRAFRWDPKTGGGLQNLGTLPAGTYSKAYAINSKGQVVGVADSGGQDHAFLWDPKIKDPQDRMQDLGTLGGAWSHAYATNSKGQVVGDSQPSGGGDGHAFLWDPKTKAMQDLGTLGGTWSFALWINSKGQVCGRSQTASGEEHAFLWDPKIGEIQDLGTLGGDLSQDFSINSKGQVVGYSTTSGGQERGFLWDPKTKAMVDLGTPMGGTEAGADDINAKGQVAGYSKDAGGFQHAVIWKP